MLLFLDSLFCLWGDRFGVDHVVIDDGKGSVLTSNDDSDDSNSAYPEVLLKCNVDSN
jgi:hypothetical protein